jgi:hypothetical protein
MTIVQLSDVHVGTIRNSGFLTELVRRTNELKPDIVMITGDLIDGSGPVDIHTFAPLNSLKSKTFFTTGNHERYHGVEETLAVLEKSNIDVLRNEVTEYKGVQIVGLDDPDQEFGTSIPALKSIKINQSKPAIMMLHRPVGLEEAHDAGIDLQLSGHTHNGQIFPLNLLVKPFFPRINGLYEYKGTYLYTSPGTGTWGPPMRLGSRSEITVIHLVKK